MCSYFYLCQNQEEDNLSVGLGDTLDLLFLLEGEAVGGLLGGVDDLVGEALGDGLDVPEGGLARALAEHADGDVHTTERGNIDRLTLDVTALFSERRGKDSTIKSQKYFEKGKDNPSKKGEQEEQKESKKEKKCIQSQHEWNLHGWRRCRWRRPRLGWGSSRSSSG